MILTDEQAHPASSSRGRIPDAQGVLDRIPGPVVTFNLAGHRAAHMESGAGRLTVGGLTDAGFRMLDLLDRRAGGDWPF